MLAKKLVGFVVLLLLSQPASAWGFYAHELIHRQAIWLLPPDMLVLFKPNQDWLATHATDPDKRRYIVPNEGPKHFLDIDHYGVAPYTMLPRRYDVAVAKFGKDSVWRYGVVPWQVQWGLLQLTNAFKSKEVAAILQAAADLGHYVADAHVPLHVCSNHNGQFTNQTGIHGIWESQVPELLAPTEWQFWLPQAQYLTDPEQWIWQRVLESAAMADTVLRVDRALRQIVPDAQQFAFVERNGKMVRQSSPAWLRLYHEGLQGMVERRLMTTIHAVASCWYTAWVNAGQPQFTKAAPVSFGAQYQASWKAMDSVWRHQSSAAGECGH